MRNTAKTINEIADDLGVSPVYVETEVEFLEEYGFLQAWKDKYIVNGREYEFHGDIPSITTAQYIDYQTYMKEKPVDLQKVISVFLIPKGHTYNDGYKIEEVMADISDMLIVDVQALGFFIQKQSALFILITKDYLSHQMKKMKIPTQKIREDLTPLSDLALSLLS